MKKIIVFVSILILSFAYLSGRSKKEKKRDYEAETDTNTRAEWMTENKIEPLILDLPVGLDNEQVSDTYKFEDQYFAIFQKSNFNFPVSSDVQRSGVLTANEGDTSWKILLEIEDLPETKNNPYDIAIYNGVMYVLIVDHNGAGSGEGIAKLIKSNNRGKSWEITDCFYFTVETFLQAANKTTSLLNTVEIYPSINPPFTERYEFNKAKGYYETKIVDENGSTKIVKEEHCLDFKILSVN